MTSDNVRPHHPKRKALLYARQSSAHQVLHNRESGVLKYAMRDRLTALGWSEIEVIDDDLGRSAAGGIHTAMRRTRTVGCRKRSRWSSKGAGAWQCEAGTALDP